MENELKSIGINKAQIKLYLTSLKFGPLSVLELSKKTGLHRQMIYENAEKMIKIGLYEYVSTNKRKFIAAEPSVILKLANDLRKKSEKIYEKIGVLVPKLEKLVKKNKKDLNTIYFEGIDKIRQAYLLELKKTKNSEVLSLVGSIEDLYAYFSEDFWGKWNKNFVKNHSNSKMLVHPSKEAFKTIQFDKTYRRETKFLDNFKLKVNIDIFNNTVLIVSFYDEIAIWIDSAMIAESYRIIFNFLWDGSSHFSNLSPVKRQH